MTPATPRFTRKDFVWMAQFWKEQLMTSVVEGHVQVISMLIRDFATELEHTNPAFDRDRFLTAAGLGGMG